MLDSGQGDSDVASTTRGLPPGLSEDLDATDNDYADLTEPAVTPKNDSVSSVSPIAALDAAVAPESEGQDYFGVCPICTCQLTPVLSNLQPETTINDSSRTGNIS